MIYGPLSEPSGRKDRAGRQAGALPGLSGKLPPGCAAAGFPSGSVTYRWVPLSSPSVGGNDLIS